MVRAEICGYDIKLQPQIQLNSGELVGAEVLIRGEGMDGSVIYPELFVSEMEQRNQIAEIDLWVMEHTCRLLKTWKEKGKSKPRISVNLSRDTLNSAVNMAQMISLCRESGVDPESIILEITERCTEEKAGSRIIEHAESLHRAGFSLSLDDYGSGFSNLRALSEIEFSELKIDKSLICDLTKNRRSRIVVGTIINMCREMGDVRCIAEGIESESQVHLLRELGCEYGQGYYFYKPMSVNEFENYFMVSALAFSS